nr:zinc finger, PHD-type [Tanacetum cinerariifolium]
GYFQALFSCIEVLLALPSADEAELKEYRKNYQLIVFHGTSILYKTVQKLETSKEE